MNNNFDSLIDLLKTDERYVAEDGDLLKAKVYQDAMMMEESLLNLLLSQEETKEAFFTEVGDTLVFDKYEFAWLINSKEFLPDSYTAYTNKIGLATNRKFISQADDVVLDFPYKDAVLAGGQEKDDQKRDEIVFHSILAREQIMNMLTPKVFTNAKRYTAVGDKDLDGKLIPETIEVKEELATEFKEGDNLIIRGNNLIALSCLLERYEGKIKLIYIDPPFNTGKDSFKYNDKFNRSSWLTFMKNRLEIARQLLSNTGSILVHIDWHEAHYLKILLDEIFDENNFRNEIIWHYSSGGDYKNTFAKKHDTIFWYSKTATYNFFPENEMVGEKRGSEKKNNMKRNVDDDGRVYFSITSAGKEYRYYEDDLVTPDDIWEISILQQKDPERTGFNSQKPEKLLARIIGAFSERGDLILDYHIGSGTTCAVAHKMGRKYIGIEQMEYINTVPVPRLHNVILGEQGGISQDVDWQGGGSFVYCELKEDGQTLIDAIQASDENTISEIKNYIYQDERIVPYLTAQELEAVDNEFEHLDINDKKKVLIELVDKNKLYVNYSSIDDEDYDVSDENKSFTHSFYEVAK